MANLGDNRAAAEDRSRELCARRDQLLAQIERLQRTKAEASKTRSPDLSPHAPASPTI